MVALPALTPRTRPVADTVATAGPPDVQVRSAVGVTVVPSDRVRVAVSCRFFFTASSGLGGLTVSVRGTAGPTVTTVTTVLAVMAGFAFSTTVVLAVPVPTALTVMVTLSTVATAVLSDVAVTSVTASAVLPLS